MFRVAPSPILADVLRALIVDHVQALLQLLEVMLVFLGAAFAVTRPTAFVPQFDPSLLARHHTDAAFRVQFFDVLALFAAVARFGAGPVIFGVVVRVSVALVVVVAVSFEGVVVVHFVGHA